MPRTDSTTHRASAGNGHATFDAERIRSLVESSEDAISVLDREGNALYRSPAAHRLLGYAEEELADKPPLWFVHPDDRADIEGIFQRLLADPGRVEPLEVRIHTKSGEWRFCEGNARNLLEDPAVGGIVLNWRDATERRAMVRALARREKILRAVSHAAERLILSRRWEHDLQSVLADLGASAEVHRVALVKGPFGHDEIPPSLLRSWSVNGEHDPARLRDRIARVVGSREVVRDLIAGRVLQGSPDGYDEPGREALAAEGVRSLLLVPILVHDVLWGVLALEDLTSDQAWPDAEVEAIRTAANLINGAIRRDEAGRALRESEERFRQLAEGLREVLWISDPGFTRVLYVNPQYETLWGRTRKELYDDPRSFLDALHPEDRDRVEASLPSIATGEYDVEYRIVRPDGSVRWVWARVFPVRSENGEPRVVGLVEDVTDRRRASRELRERAAQQDAVVRLGQSALEERPIETVLDEVAPVVAEVLEADFTSIRELSPDGRHMLRRSGVGWLVDETPEAIPLEGKNWIQEALDAGRPVVVERPADDDASLDAFLREHGVRSGVIAPIMDSDRPFGVLSVFCRKPRAFSANDLQFVQAVAGLVGQIVRRSHIRRELHFHAGLLNAVGQAVIATDPAGRITYWNQAAETLYGWTRDEALGSDVVELTPSLTSRDEARRLMGTHEDVEPWSGEIELKRKDGSTFPALITTSPIRDERGEPVGAVGVSTDITERKKLELHLRQAQKMEAIGQLAGGVAHDFNNLLTAIKGYAEFVLLDLTEDDPHHESLIEIDKAADQAARLTTQLLAYSRRQMLQPVRLDLNEVVRDMQHMIRRLIPESIDLTTSLDPELDEVQVDPGQLEQILMNLAVNARDAMPDGGRLTIETANVTLRERLVYDDFTVEIGPYVMLKVSDTGIGMGEEVRKHLFEPFFTTKEVGRGTGLGLSTVYGIIKQSGGYIWVHSEPEMGSTFKIYLPRAGDGAPLEETLESEELMEGQGQTILVVEDQDSVRGLACKVLRQKGYRVLEAADGAVALEIARRDGPIDLLFTDVVMPEMSGRTLAATLEGEMPDLRVLYSSGYTSAEMIEGGVARGVLKAGIEFLPKPYTPSELALKVRQVLESQVGNPS